MKYFFLLLALCLRGWANTAPTLISYAQTTNFTSGATSKTVTVPSFQAGDTIVVIGGDAGTATEKFSTPTASGLTFTDVFNHQAASNCAAILSVATAAGSGTSVVVTLANSSNTPHFGFGVWVWRGSAGTGNSGSSFTATKVVSITPAGGADSAFVWGVFDWGAAAVQTIAPTPTNTRDRAVDSGQYTFYVADLIDQAGTGAVSYGISGSGSGPFSIVAIEIEGTAGGGGGSTCQPTMTTTGGSGCG